MHFFSRKKHSGKKRIIGCLNIQVKHNYSNKVEFIVLAQIEKFVQTVPYTFALLWQWLFQVFCTSAINRRFLPITRAYEFELWKKCNFLWRCGFISWACALALSENLFNGFMDFAIYLKHGRAHAPKFEKWRLLQKFFALLFSLLHAHKAYLYKIPSN